MSLVRWLNEDQHEGERAGGGNLRTEGSGRPNGLEVNPRGQGPRAEAAAARRMPAFEARDAGGVTPLQYRRTSRLGRRAEAGPRRVLPRVRPPRDVGRPATGKQQEVAR